MVRPGFIKKQHPDMPDHYGITVHLLTGEVLKLEVATHSINTFLFIESRNGEYQIDNKWYRKEINPAPVLEYNSKDDFWGSVPMTSIAYFHLDERWSKAMALRQEIAQTAKQEKPTT